MITAQLALHVIMSVALYCRSCSNPPCNRLMALIPPRPDLQTIYTRVLYYYMLLEFLYIWRHSDVEFGLIFFPRMFDTSRSISSSTSRQWAFYLSCFDLDTMQHKLPWVIVYIPIYGVIVTSKQTWKIFSCILWHAPIDFKSKEPSLTFLPFMVWSGRDAT